MRIGRRSSGWFIVAVRLVGRSAELATTAAVCIATAAWANVCRSPRQMNNFGNGRIATSRHLILGSFADLAPSSLLMIRPPYGVCAFICFDQNQRRAACWPSHPRRCGRSAGLLRRPFLAIGLRRRCGARRAEGERYLFPAPIPRQGP